MRKKVRKMSREQKSWVRQLFETFVTLITTNGRLKTNNETLSYYDKVAAGLIEGAYIVHKFGLFENQSTTAYNTIWDGGVAYPYLTRGTEIQMTIRSETDVTANQIIEIEGVDKLYNKVIQTVQLTGTTPVVVTLPYFLVYRMRNTGPTKIAGNVLLENGGTLYAKISNGVRNYNQTQMSLFIVPAGHWALVTLVGASSGTGKDVELAYNAWKVGEIMQVKRPVILAAGVYVEDFSVPHFFDEGTVLEVAGKAEQAGTSVAAWFDILLFNKSTYNA